MKRISKCVPVLAACWMVLSYQAVVNATPMLWEDPTGQSHWYEMVLPHGPGGSYITWDWAESDARSQVYQGMTGYLVTITSQQEQDFIEDNILGDQHSPWLGGWQNPDSPEFSEPGDGWEWITGESWDYTNWGAGEPSNGGYIPSEDHLVMQQGATERGTWNDYYDDGNVRAYIVEYVPEPSTLALSGIGLLVLLRRR